MKIGYIVSPVEGGKGHLRSGSEAWSGAVVVSVDPFVMVSPCSTMKWSQCDPNDFKAVGIAQPATINEAMTRMEPEEQIRMPVGESFLDAELGNGLQLLRRGLTPMAIDLVKKDFCGRENKSYGWLFFWAREQGFWKPLRAATADEVAEARAQFKTGIVKDSEDGKDFLLKTASRQIEDLADAEQLVATLSSGLVIDNRQLANPDYQISMEVRGKDTAYWTVHVEDDDVTVQFIPSIQVQLAQSAGMYSTHYLSLNKTIRTALQGKLAQEVGHDKIDEIVKQWFDDHVARGTIILPNKEKEE
jgi:hypothetical protein